MAQECGETACVFWEHGSGIDGMNKSQQREENTKKDKVWHMAHIKRLKESDLQINGE